MSTTTTWTDPRRPEWGEWVVPERWTPDRTGACRSCGARVLWATTPTGKPSPLNPDGTSHFATCPDAAMWRRSRAAAPPRLPGDVSRRLATARDATIRVQVPEWIADAVAAAPEGRRFVVARLERKAADPVLPSSSLILELEAATRGLEAVRALPVSQYPMLEGAAVEALVSRAAVLAIFEEGKE